jgi:ethanolamine ammonia-lyase large subunit
MPTYVSDFQGERHRFTDLKDVLAKASARRSGDELAGVAAETDAQRIAARSVLADLPLSVFLDDPVVPYETDEVTRLILDTHDTAAFSAIAHLTVGGLRDWLLSYDATPERLAGLVAAITPEMAAAASKLMRNQDLISVASRCRITTAFRNTQGLAGHLGSRLQPNHPTDDLRGIAAATIDGLLLGCGDAVIGVNPASDSVAGGIAVLDMLETLRLRHDIPTQTCVLTHVTNTLEMIRLGAPVDLVFQSIAGTEAANAGFGVNLGILREARDAALSLKRGTIGDNVM